jgi:hypothetical protein
MKVFQLRGYPENHYFVDHDDWNTILQWMWQHNVDYLQQSSSPHGIGFSIRSNFEWFSLKWL